jgi:hypothetical protein
MPAHSVAPRGYFDLGIFGAKSQSADRNEGAQHYRAPTCWLDSSQNENVRNDNMRYYFVPLIFCLLSLSALTAVPDELGSDLLVTSPPPPLVFKTNAQPRLTE